jgi:hypothetical protein
VRTPRSKASTDKAYDDALVLLLRRISTDLKNNPTGVPLVGAYFGTHNKESCELVKDRLVAEGLGHKVKETGRIRLMDGVAGRVCTGQLYGESPRVESGSHLIMKLIDGVSSRRHVGRVDRERRGDVRKVGDADGQ